MIDSLLDKYCQHSTGAFLLPLPTGFGKTHQVIEYIARIYPELGERKIFFITNLKKNLPYEKLRARFSQQNLEAAFNEHVIFLDSNFETVISNLQSVADEYYNEISQFEGFDTLYSSVKVLTKLRQDGKPELKDLQKSLEDQIRKDLEPKFRNQVESWVKEKFRTENGRIIRDRLLRIRKVKKDFKWLPLLYPAVLTADKKIFFLSADKFFVKNTTLIEPSSYFLDDDLTENALIFIDEFDASKKHFLSAIVRNGNQRRIDLLRLFAQIHSGLQNTILPQDLILDSAIREQSRRIKPQLQDLELIIQGTIGKSQDLLQQYRLDFVLKTNQPDTKRNFLFHDFRYHTVLSGSRKFISVLTNLHLRQNTLIFSEVKQEAGESLYPLLSSLRGYISYFMGSIRILAINYQQLKKESGQKEYSLESAIRSILNLLNLSDEEMNYLIDGILQEVWKNGRKEEAQALPDMNFYLQGFRYYDFLDSEDHDLQSRIFLHNYENTPEKFLLSLCQRANVIGISATAEIKTVVGNYDLKFLSSRLGENFRKITVAEEEALTLSYENHTAGYKHVNLDVQWVQAQGSLIEFAELLEDEELAADIFNKIPSDRDDVKKRYVRLFKCLKEFVHQPDQLSFLWLASPLARNTDKAPFNRIIIEKAAARFVVLAAKNTNLPFHKNIVCFLTGDDYDQQKDRLQSRLQQGDKIFVISAYNTVGAGQNLQYKAPKNILPQLLKVNDLPNESMEKDFDGIYVEKPTSLLINLNSSNKLEEEAFVEAIFQVEALAQKGEISQEHLLNRIKRGFVLLSGGNRNASNYDKSFNSLYSKDDFAYNSTRIVMQAVGRLSRSSLKNRKIAIRVDQELQPLLAKANELPALLTPEFKAIMNHCSHSKPTSQVQQLINKAENANIHAHSFIQRLLKREHSSRPKNWKLLREIVLKHPTLVGNELEAYPQLLDFYVELPAGFHGIDFSQINDDGLISNIQFTNSTSAKVCAQAANLPLLMQNQPIRTFFEENGYATEFHTNPRYILSPALFNDIYKGALGEVVGKYTMNIFGLELVDLPYEEFELFDYKTACGLYFDFKHWNSNASIVEEQEYLEKIRSKTRQVGARQVIIANLFSHHSAEVSQTEDKIVKVPALLNLSDGGFHSKNLHTLQNYLSL